MREKKKEYHDNKTKAYGLIWGRCSPSMQSALESREDFERGIKNDPIGLLKAIKQHALNYREHRYEMSIIADALRTLLLSKQKEDEDIVAYTRRFRTAAEVLESHMGVPIILQNYVRNMEGSSGISEEFLDTIQEADAEILKIKYIKKFDIYEKRFKAYGDNKHKAYAVIWGRCSAKM
mmetsp:Transcript_31752/g.77092  ORF Transcript_31752/g.77092 Transcript_31752/m.77092 type:complete len:178 (+) Transcript_31752:487-1020(+)